jgi:hypothetical protein
MARKNSRWFWILAIIILLGGVAWYATTRLRIQPVEPEPAGAALPESAMPLPEPEYTPLDGADRGQNAGYDVTGKVASEMGEAISGAEVSLYRSAPRWSPPVFEQPNPLETGISNDQGQYQFHLNAAANLWIGIRKEGYARITAFLPVRDTRSTVRDFQLRTGQATLVGFVFDRQDMPVAGALVVANAPPLAIVADNPVIFPAGQLTDSAGKYTLEGLPDGDVAVIASARGFTFGEELGTLKAGQSQQIDFHLSPATPISFAVKNGRGEGIAYATASAPGQFKLAGGDGKGLIEVSLPLELSPFDCTVSADGYLSRTILLDPKAPPAAVVLEDRPALRGRVTAESGGAVPEALVSIWGTGGAQGKFDGAVLTDKAGRFLLPLSYPPVREIKITRLGYLDQRLTFDVNNPPPPEVVVRMKRVEAGLYGRVVDSHGIPVKRFVVHLRDAAAKPGGEEYQRSFSDERGAFMITDIAPGTYTLQIQSVLSATTDNVQLATRERVEVRKGFLFGEVLVQFPPLTPGR